MRAKEPLAVPFCTVWYYRIIGLLILSLPANKINGQGCPSNIDFENGSFNSWTCHTGSVAALNGQNVITLQPSGPLNNQHEILSSLSNGSQRDFYGDFPVVCPNGSGYSIKLGNITGGAQAEGISYEFTIPANRNTYSLIYHYAVVFQDPNHQEYEQPRLVLDVTNVTDNQQISCSSFTFFPNGSPLPGFFLSPRSDSTAVWCKDWSAVTINLNGQAGKTIRLFFKTADCTFRRHFGYAYIDVDTECSSEFTGATYCPDDTSVTITAPYGYQQYTWYNAAFTQQLGSQQTLHLAPPPPRGTTYAVELIPYNGYGCLDTLYANLVDTLTLVANAGADAIACNNNPVLIGSNQKQGVVYSWYPATNLSNPFMANPLANPSVTTSYELTVSSTGGGCINKDTVIVKASVVDSTLRLSGKPLFCINSGDSAVLMVTPTQQVQWYRDNTIINGAVQPGYRVTQSGSYYAALKDSLGCTNQTRTALITIEVPRPGIHYPLQYAIINSPVQLSARTFGESVLWKPPVFLDDPARPDPYFNTPFVRDQLYTIEITTVSGCRTVDTQLVKSIKEVKIYMPTAFTPNNDGLNDYLKPILVGVKEIQYFSIYNRWGKIVFNGQMNDKGWNGMINGLPQASDVFVWVIQATGLDNRKYFQKGTVLLIR